MLNFNLNMTALVFAPASSNQKIWCRESTAKRFRREQDGRLDVAPILTFIRKAGGVFDDQVTQIMGEAFDRACNELHDKGQPEIVYEVIAKRIVEAVRNGERDPIRLRNAGLAALGPTAVMETS
jgi:hypothetical protein